MASLYNKTNKVSGRASSGIFTPKSASKSRLLSVPSGAASAFVAASAEKVASAADSMASAVALDAIPAMSNASFTAQAMSPQAGPSFFRYIIIFLVLAFLFFSLFLFFIKPADTSITQLYAPVANYFNRRKAHPVVKEDSDTSASASSSASSTSASARSTSTSAYEKSVDKAKPSYKKLPVIPETDQSIQPHTPLSKTGFCYIGEDRGVRSCIDVGEGDVCMSGDIFPSQAICINPNLRA